MVNSGHRPYSGPHFISEDTEVIQKVLVRLSKTEYSSRRHFESKMEQRCTARVRFSASAELIRGDLVESTLVTELSLRGCYVEPTSPLPRGTLLTVKIFAGGEFFQATATVLYSRATLGMGLCFSGVKPEFQRVLRKWLRQALDASNTALPPIHDCKSETDS